MNVGPLNTSDRCDRGEHDDCVRDSCECSCHVIVCGCGLTYSLPAFRELAPPSRGLYQDLPDDGEKPERLEYRNCSCGSTLCLGVPRE